MHYKYTNIHLCLLILNRFNMKKVKQNQTTCYEDLEALFMEAGYCRVVFTNLYLFKKISYNLYEYLYGEEASGKLRGGRGYTPLPPFQTQVYHAFTCISF